MRSFRLGARASRSPWSRRSSPPGTSPRRRSPLGGLPHVRRDLRRVRALSGRAPRARALGPVSETRPPDASASASASASPGVGSVRVATITDASVPDERKARLLLVFGGTRASSSRANPRCGSRASSSGIRRVRPGPNRAPPSPNPSPWTRPEPHHPPGSIPGPSSVAEWARALTHRCVALSSRSRSPASRKRRRSDQCARKPPPASTSTETGPSGSSATPRTASAGRRGIPRPRTVQRAGEPPCGASRSSRPHVPQTSTAGSGRCTCRGTGPRAPRAPAGRGVAAGAPERALRVRPRRGRGGERVPHQGDQQDWMYGEADALPAHVRTLGADGEEREGRGGRQG